MQLNVRLLISDAGCCCKASSLLGKKRRPKSFHLNWWLRWKVGRSGSRSQAIAFFYLGVSWFWESRWSYADVCECGRVSECACVRVRVDVRTGAARPPQRDGGSNNTRFLTFCRKLGWPVGKIFVSSHLGEKIWTQIEILR